MSESFLLPQTPGQNVQVYTSTPSEAGTPGPTITVDPLVAQSEVVPNEVQPVSVSSETQQPETPVQDPAAPEQQAPPDPFPPLSPDGTQVNIYVTDDFGQKRFYTSIPNTAEAIQEYTQRNLEYIRQLKTGAVQSQTPQQQAPVQPPQPKDARTTIAEKVRAAADARLKSIDPDLNVDPLVELLTDILEDQHTTEEAQRQQQEASLRNVREMAEIKAIDPRFDVSDPNSANAKFILQVRADMRAETGRDPAPSEVYAKILYYEKLNEARSAANGNGATATASAQKPAAPIPARIPQSPAQAFVTPQGSTHTGAAADSLENHPEVVEALAQHPRNMKDMGLAVTPQSIQRCRELTIMGIRNRGTFMPQTNRSL